MTVLVYMVGFLAQGFFSARILVQWFLSEKSHKVVSPGVYWVCSLVGSILLFAYGWLRDDFSIVLGQMLSYYVYIWNLSVKGMWQKLPVVARTVLYALPAGMVLVMTHDFKAFSTAFFHNSDVPLPLLLWGSAGQVVFTLRFVYQWAYSYRRGESVLPVGFWVISLAGSGIIISYAMFRLDPVLIIGQSVGFVAYTRNIIINKHSKG